MDIFDENKFVSLIKQAEQVQDRLKNMQEHLTHFDVEGVSGSGLVTVSMNCKYRVQKINIDPTLIQEDISVIEDLVAIAVNDAVHKVETHVRDKMSGLSKEFLKENPGGAE